jgi:hypothetical protein
LGNNVDVCKSPEVPRNLPAPVTDGPYFYMGKALALKAWDTPEEVRRLANLSASTVFSWVHVPAHKKLMAPVTGYTIEVVYDLVIISFLLYCFCKIHLF